MPLVLPLIRETVVMLHSFLNGSNPSGFKRHVCHWCNTFLEVLTALALCNQAARLRITARDGQVRVNDRPETCPVTQQVRAFSSYKLKRGQATPPSMRASTSVERKPTALFRPCNTLRHSIPDRARSSTHRKLFPKSDATSWRRNMRGCFGLGCSALSLVCMLDRIRFLSAFDNEGSAFSIAFTAFAVTSNMWHLLLFVVDSALHLY